MAEKNILHPSTYTPFLELKIILIARKGIKQFMQNLEHSSSSVHIPC